MPSAIFGASSLRLPIQPLHACHHGSPAAAHAEVNHTMKDMPLVTPEMCQMPAQQPGHLQLAASDQRTMLTHIHEPKQRSTSSSAKVGMPVQHSADLRMPPASRMADSVQDRRQKMAAMPNMTAVPSHVAGNKVEEQLAVSSRCSECETATELEQHHLKRGAVACQGTVVIRDTLSGVMACVAVLCLKSKA